MLCHYDTKHINRITCLTHDLLTESYIIKMLHVIFNPDRRSSKFKNRDARQSNPSLLEYKEHLNFLRYETGVLLKTVTK